MMKVATVEADQKVNKLNKVQMLYAYKNVDSWWESLLSRA